jgi:hypothetical protein
VLLMLLQDKINPTLLVLTGTAVMLLSFKTTSVIWSAVAWAAVCLVQSPRPEFGPAPLLVGTLDCLSFGADPVDLNPRAARGRNETRESGEK